MAWSSISVFSLFTLKIEDLLRNIRKDFLLVCGVLESEGLGELDKHFSTDFLLGMEGESFKELKLRKLLFLKQKKI